MFTSSYLMHRVAEEVRRDLLAEADRERLTDLATGPRQRSLSDLVMAVTAALRVLWQELTTQPVRRLQRAQ